MVLRLRSAFLPVAGSAMVALSFAAALTFPVTVAQPRPAESAQPASTDTVNRAAKGDRLRVIVRPPDAEPFDVQLPGKPGPQLLDGCESILALTDHSPAAKLPRSCVT